MANKDKTSINSNIIKKALKEARTEMGYTQQAIADETGLSRQMISKIESDNGNPTLTSLIRYCNAINFDITKVISGALEKEAKKKCNKVKKATK